MQPLIQWSGTHRILIADDEPDIHAVTRLSLKALSRKSGPTEFVSAASGKETLALLQQHPDVGVILLDVVMETDTAGLLSSLLLTLVPSSTSAADPPALAKRTP